MPAYDDGMFAYTRLRYLIVPAALAGLLLLGSWTLWRTAGRRREHRYDALIQAAASRYGVDPGLIAAVIWRESGFRANRVGRAGEVGLMQVREPAARDWARASSLTDFRATDLTDPGTNILAGTWYLSRALRRWSARDCPAAYALAEYNAGPTHARRWAAAPGADTAAGFEAAITFPSTRRYVRDVLRRARETR